MNNELSIGACTYLEMIDTFRQATKDHFAEVPFGDYKIELNPNDDIYLNAEREGHARFYVAFQGRNPAGYIIIFASEMAHHKGVMCAVTDSFYVVPEYRKDGIFGKLLTYVEQDIKSLGIRFLTIGHNPQYKGKTPDLLLSEGYSVTEVSYTKEV